MKIDRTNKAFQPIELKIIIETEEEYKSIKYFTGMNLSIPKMMRIDMVDEKIIGDVERFTDLIWNQLDKD